MSRFEFNSVLVSILLAFAATEQLAVWGRVVRDPVRFGFSWPYLLSSAWVVLCIVSHWFLFWAFSDVDVDQARYAFLMIIPSFVLGLCSYALVPDARTSEPVLQNHWNETSGRLMFLFGSFLVAAPAVDFLLPGALAGPPPWVGLLAAATFFCAGANRLVRLRPVIVGVHAAITLLGVWNLRV
jgi:hypothetical protein